MPLQPVGPEEDERISISLAAKGKGFHVDQSSGSCAPSFKPFQQREFP
jgi:hypothetical protein